MIIKMGLASFLLYWSTWLIHRTDWRVRYVRRQYAVAGDIRGGDSSLPVPRRELPLAAPDGVLDHGTMLDNNGADRQQSTQAT